MDNDAEEEISEVSMIINREDTYDIFQIEGGNEALGTGQNKQKSLWADGVIPGYYVNYIRNWHCPPHGFTKFGFNTWMSLAERGKNTAPTAKESQEGSSGR